MDKDYAFGERFARKNDAYCRASTTRRSGAGDARVQVIGIKHREQASAGGKPPVTKR